MIPAADPHQHGLAPNAIGLLQSIVISIANSAPTAAMTVTFAALVVAAAGGGAIAILITMLPMLVIAYSFRRLNRWEANCGAQYVWVGRAIGPRLGFMTGWLVLGALLLGTVATVLPVGPSFLNLFGLDSSSQLGAALSSTVLALVVTVVAVLGITLTARVQLAMAAIEFAIVAVITVLGLWDTFISQPDGFVSPSWSWLSPTGVGGAGSLVPTLLLAVFLIAGWDASLYVNEETENAEVNPGRAVMISVIFLGLFYMLMMFAFQAVAPVSQINAHAADGLSFAADRVAGQPAEKAMSLAVLLSAVATTQIGFVTLSRVSYAMGTDGLLPPRFGQLNPRYRTPAFGTILFAVITIALRVRRSIHPPSPTLLPRSLPRRASSTARSTRSPPSLAPGTSAPSCVEEPGTCSWSRCCRLLQQLSSPGSSSSRLPTSPRPKPHPAWSTRERHRDAGHRRDEEISLLPPLPRAIQRRRLADRRVKPRRQRSDRRPGSSASCARR